MKVYLCTVKKGEKPEPLSKTIEAEYAEAALPQLIERHRGKLRAADAPTCFGKPLQLENDLRVIRKRRPAFQRQAELIEKPPGGGNAPRRELSTPQ